MIKMIKIKKQQTNNIDTKLQNVFDHLKSVSQETNNLMDEIEEVNDDIKVHMLVFIGSNKFNFRMPLNFLSAIYNGEISLIEAEIFQRKIEKKMEELKFDYRPKNDKEKEEINGVLMQANDLLEYRNKIIYTFKDGTFLSKHLKKSDAAAYDYVLKDVNDFIQEIKLIEEKINLSLFEDFFESSDQLIMQKCLLILRMQMKAGIVAEVKDRISDFKDNKRNE